MQFNSFARYTGKWVVSYYISKGKDNNFLNKYTNHFIEMLEHLSKYQIFEVSGYKLNSKEYVIQAEDIYSYDFWLSIFLTKKDYDTIDLFGNTVVNRNSKPVYLINVMQITIDFDILESFLWASIKLSNDDWLPYHFIGTAEVNYDYEKNASRLEKALSHFFCEQYQYEIDTGEETDIVGMVKGFRIDNPYTTMDHELVIYDKRGRYVDSIDPKLVK